MRAKTIAVALVSALAGGILAASSSGHAADETPETQVQHLQSDLRKAQADLDAAHRVIDRKNHRIRVLRNRLHEATHRASLSDYSPTVPR